MTVDVVGSYPHIPRKRTGLLSFDLAVADKKKGELGLPQRTSVEIYGHTNVGKSSLSYYLSGIMAAKGRVVICDIENADPDYIHTIFEGSGFDGQVWLIESSIPQKEIYPLTRVEGRKTIKIGTPRFHEEMLMDMLKSFREADTGAVILDSVGAVQSNEEQEGDLGQAFWGKRAKLMNQVSRALSGILRNKEEPANAFIINHALGVMGGRGHTTPGGDGTKFMAGVRLMLWHDVTYRLKDDDPNSVLGYLVGGQVEKLRYGGAGRQFGFYIVPGYGVHPGVSAMFDCFKYGLADAGATVKIEGKSMGYLKKDLLSYALSGKGKKFEPFQELLIAHEADIIKETDYAKPSERADIEEESKPEDISSSADDVEGAKGSVKRAKISRRKSKGGAG